MINREFNRIDNTEKYNKSSSTNTQDLEPNDEIVDELVTEDFMSVVSQLDGALAYQILGVYNDNGKVKTKAELRRDPPTLVISDGNTEVSFLLTLNFVEQLKGHLDDVYKAYFNIPLKETAPEKLISSLKRRL